MAAYGNNIVPNPFTQDSAPQNRNRNNPAIYDRPIPKLWVNIGYSFTEMNANGEEVIRFVSFPSNLGMDYMRKQAIPVLGPDASPERKAFVKRLKKGNKMFDDVMAAFETMAPGETLIMPHAPGTIGIQLSKARDMEDPDHLDDEDDINDTPNIMGMVEALRNRHGLNVDDETPESDEEITDPEDGDDNLFVTGSKKPAASRNRNKG